MRTLLIVWLSTFQLFLPGQAKAQTTVQFEPSDEPPSTVQVSLPFKLELADITYGKSRDTLVGEKRESDKEAERLAVSRAQSISYQENLNSRGATVLAQSIPGKTYPLQIEIQTKAKARVEAIWGASQWPSFNEIIMHESGWQPYITNPNGGACGLFQALPCSKLGSMDIDHQLEWGISYIQDRYGSPNNAWAFWQAHNWY